MQRTAIICILSLLIGIAIGMHLWQSDSNWQPGDSQATAAPVAVDNQASVAPPLLSPPATGSALTTEEQTNINVYDAANRSVVHVDTRSIQVDRFFHMAREAKGMGSGAVLDKLGHIITNYHVVDGARDIMVTLSTNHTYEAELVGKDMAQDIAVLKIEAPAEELYPIPLGTSDHLRVGQRVYALGNPFGWDGTLTTGIISSLNRELPSRVEDHMMQSLIQTDAAMNPGNSGGPLLDTQARMIGMCVAIATKTGENTGVGFAIPIDRIKQMVPELIENGRVIHADIGITHVMETGGALVVARLAPGGPAEKAGLQGFRRIVQERRQGNILYKTETIDRSHADRILALDGEPVRTGVRFRDKISEYRPGHQVTLTILRDGHEMEVAITLGERLNAVLIATKRDKKHEKEAGEQRKYCRMLSSIVPASDDVA